MTHGERVRRCIVKQTDPRLDPMVNRYGCRVMCLLAIPQFVCGKCLSVDQVQDIIDQGKLVPNVIVNDKLRAGSREDWLINQGFLDLNEHRHGRQTGWLPSHVETRPWEYMIVHWKTTGPDGHFTLHDKLEQMIYDPFDVEQAGYDIKLVEIQRKLVYATWGVTT